VETTKAKPFLKWAGGKGQLLSQLRPFFPEKLLNGEINSYIEPFVGGGAVFFDLVQSFQIDWAIISDMNKDLIVAYRVIRQKPADLCTKLEKLENHYYKIKEADRSTMFYEIRVMYNQQLAKINYEVFSDIWIERAAYLIFLNRTCFNGLFRLNSKNEFNVPFGKYTNPAILDSTNIFAVSSVLKNVEILMAGYTETFDRIKPETFIYFDPPYKPLNKTSNFTTYSGTGFNDSDQLQLAAYFRKIDQEKKACIMLSNSDPKNEDPENDFFEKAYQGFTINRLDALRAINSKGDKRGKIKEILVTNY
jgi:DNA adenine methylase